MIQDSRFGAVKYTCPDLVTPPPNFGHWRSHFPALSFATIHLALNCINGKFKHSDSPSPVGFRKENRSYSNSHDYGTNARTGDLDDHDSGQGPTLRLDIRPPTCKPKKLGLLIAILQLLT